MYPPDERYVLTVDLGSTGLKVGLVSLTGEIAQCEFAFVTTSRPGGGASTQDAEEWWRLVTAASRRVVEQVRPEQLVAASCTGQWASTVPVDAAGRPVGDCLLYDDTRGAPYSRAVIAGPVAGFAPRNALAWVRKTGGAPSPSGADPIGHLLFLRHEMPDVYAAARWFLEPVDYLTMRMTGVAAATHASMTAAWLTDNRRPDVPRYDTGLARRAGVDIGKLPPLRGIGSVVGGVSAGAAGELGVPEGLPVVTGLPDLHAAVCGAGLDDYQAHLAISTTSWIGLSVPFKKTDVLRSIASVPGLRDGSYVVANNHETGGRCLQWLNEGVLGAPATRDADYERLAARAAGVPPGGNGVIFTPWLDGERSPVDDRDARAGFHNLSLTTTQDDLVRAVLEGVAYNNRWLHEAVERFAGRRLDPIRLIGGGARSDLWCQIHADVLGRTVERVADPINATLRGQAVFAALSLGAVRREDVRIRVDRVFRPDAPAGAEYERLYREFPGLYRSQRGMFRRLARSRAPVSRAAVRQPR
ncbi:xylulokinase [Actinomadura latina]|uniref:Carbohydrate kinase n=1 Tax=Actinomadura latina TaxID=163603 RepID=A0A846YYK2_9ACTN|nr:FGGY-family carbohydrate kinase [Actinomadura latina]NKZ03862.1 carbohydrate kinase [Actinomadura latina]